MLEAMEGRISSRANNAQANMMRNKLQLVARKLEQKVYRVKANEHRTTKELWSLIGEIEGYLSVREVLSPEIGIDGYMRELKGKLHMLRDLECLAG